MDYRYPSNKQKPFATKTRARLLSYGSIILLILLSMPWLIFRANATIHFVLPNEHSKYTQKETIPLPKTLKIYTQKSKEAIKSDAVPATTQTEKTDKIEKAEAVPDLVPGPMNWINLSIREGDSLSAIFKDVGLTDKDLNRLSALPQANKILKTIQPNHEMRLLIDDHNQLEELHYAINLEKTLVIKRDNKEFSSHIAKQHIKPQLAFASGTVNHSFATSTKHAGLSPILSLKFSKIFAPKIDFGKDIRTNDKFAVLYNDYVMPDGRHHSGEIVAATISNRGKLYNAVLFKGSHGEKNYYDAKGFSLQSAFLRAPITYTHISDPFSMKRKHPILNIVRPHLGTDFAAHAGTPVHASSDGRIIFRGRKGGYGNTIIIKHNSTYKSLYAHMSQFAKSVRSGSWVHRGQTIGFVGSTGMATGPHLHYEFHIHNVPVNPMHVTLPKAAPIPIKERPQFQHYANSLLKKLKTHEFAKIMKPINADNPRVS